MKITEVRIKLMPSRNDDHLRAFCSITFDDCFVVRDLKIIEGYNGPFVAMPSRKMQTHCPKCRTKNYVLAAYCNNCGSRLEENQIDTDQDSRLKPYFDIAHPITSACRDMIHQRVLAEYRDEKERAKQPGYVSRYDGLGCQDYEYRPAAQPTPTDQSSPSSCSRKYPHNDQFGEGIL